MITIMLPPRITMQTLTEGGQGDPIRSQICALGKLQLAGGFKPGLSGWVSGLLLPSSSSPGNSRTHIAAIQFAQRLCKAGNRQESCQRLWKSLGLTAGSRRRSRDRRECRSCAWSVPAHCGVRLQGWARACVCTDGCKRGLTPFLFPGTKPALFLSITGDHSAFFFPAISLLLLPSAGGGGFLPLPRSNCALKFLPRLTPGPLLCMCGLLDCVALINK